ncbi:MAG: PorT family protein [Saprospiraceae bacterium]|nr:PorT family protein [Saprospiraceae bacterium]
MNNRHLIVAVLLLINYATSSAQAARFNAGLAAGFNVATLEGERITDYIGANLGVLGMVQLNEQINVGLEFLFSQNGEYILPESYPALAYGKIRLNHLEIPLYLSWQMPNFQAGKTSPSHLSFSVGIAYARLLSFFAEDVNRMDISQQIKYDRMDAILLQGGASYALSKRLQVNLRASLPFRREGLLWTLAARLVYWVG